MEQSSHLTNLIESGLPVAGFRSSGWLDEILIRICVALQLTPTQYQEAAAHYSAVAKWLAAPGSPLATVPQEIYPQGSLRIGTTVRPLRQEEYDLDLVLWLDLHDEIDPVYLLNLLERRLREHGVYAPMLERKNRCIRLNFAGQFHLDILPARPDLRLGGTHVLVPDRAAAAWKESNPKGYATWFEERGHLATTMAAKRAAADVEPLPLPEEARDKNALQLAVQLLKRQRDLSFEETPDRAPISIVLTTLAGLHYSGDVQPFDALRGIVGSVTDSIPTSGRLTIVNPANPLEDLSERWDQDRAAYTGFVEWINGLERELTLIADSQGIPDLTESLERLFGHGPVQRALRSHASALKELESAERLAVTRTGSLTTTASSGAVTIQRHTNYGE